MLAKHARVLGMGHIQLVRVPVSHFDDPSDDSQF